MHIKKIIVLLTCIFLGLQGLTAEAGEINVSAAASLKDVFKDILAGYKAKVPETTILTNFGASGALAKQIVQGAPAEVFVSADEKWLDYLVKEGKGDAASKTLLAHNTLVFVGKKDLSILSLAAVAKLNRIAIGSPASVPAGNYAMQSLRAAGIYEELEKETKLVMAQDVRQALLYADRGEVDGAFVYKTDALLAENAVILLTVPDNLHDPIVYPMVLTSAGSGNSEAKGFFEYLKSEPVAEMLKKYQFATGK